jgi:hypothetical protein
MTLTLARIGILVVLAVVIAVVSFILGWVAGRQERESEPDPPEQMRHMRRWQAEQESDGGQ